MRPNFRVTAIVAPLALLAACAGSPHLNPYGGLFPEKYTVKTAAPPADPALYRDKTVAIVSSQNFEKYVAFWRQVYERGGAERAAASTSAIASAMGSFGGGSFATGMQAGAQIGAAEVGGRRNETDPRRISDVAVASLKRSFKNVIVAQDFADARDQHADFIALVDFHANQSVGVIVDKVRMWAGVYMHDAQLNQIFKVESTTEASTGLIGTGYIETHARAMTKTVDEMKQGLAARLP